MFFFELAMLLNYYICAKFIQLIIQSIFFLFKEYTPFNLRYFFQLFQFSFILSNHFGKIVFDNLIFSLICSSNLIFNQCLIPQWAIILSHYSHLIPFPLIFYQNSQYYLCVLEIRMIFIDLMSSLLSIFFSQILVWIAQQQQIQHYQARPIGNHMIDLFKYFKQLTVGIWHPIFCIYE